MKRWRMVAALWAAAPLLASRAAAEPAALDHVQELRAAKAAYEAKYPSDAEGLPKPKVRCADLNRKYFAARDVTHPSEDLTRELDATFAFRQRVECLVYKCPPGAECRPAPTREALVDAFEQTRGAIANCLRPQCSAQEEAQRRRALLDIFIVIVRNHREGDPVLVRALQQIAIGLPSDALAAELSKLLAQGKLPLADKIAIIEAVTQNASPELAEILASSTRADEMLLLLRAARDLKTPEGARAVSTAIDLMVKHNPGLDTRLAQEMARGSPRASDLPAKLRSLVRIMTNAERTELSQLQAAMLRWRVVHTSDRSLRALVVDRARELCRRRDPNAAPIADCGTITNGFWLGFASQSGLLPEGADPAHIPGTAAEVLQKSQQALSASAKDAHACTDAERRQLGELCVHPYAGVYVLEAFEQDGQICAAVDYVVRSINAIFNVSSERDVLCASTPYEADLRGVELATIALRLSTVSKQPGVVATAERKPPPVEPVQPHWWRDGLLRPVSFVAGFAGMVAGVYMNNTKPESDVGDWVWRGGMGLSATAITLELVF